MTMLTPDQIHAYRRDGYLHLRGLFSPEEAAAYRAEVHAIAEGQGPTDATWESVKDGATRLIHCHDVQFRSAAFTRLLLDPRVTGTAQSIIGPNVQLHHTKMFVKPPEQGSPFPMHQDHPYFPHRDHSLIAMIFHFDDAPEERGCLRVYPGSHALGPLPAVGADHHLAKDRFPLAGATPLPAKAGDMIVFSYLLAHGSGLNRSDEARTTLLVQLRDPADVQLNDRHASRGQGMMLAGVDPTATPFRFAWDAAA
ncbi:phytanoyl-CoA dioxygenase family protein [Sphingomonas jatrophae]|uniref:Ectoine hydroxylase-related dioxygenase, phytanoyl-CoA dioxygenase (PhyH) family n=1 Tax=Sphingomonas jatrophae TaxID=1166337 RepID=A0A1I6K849_9SPHN|nr:phytanoyl-CoA dioxygenase family protein [Sphingomonas jatrophae]SFR87377.1 Ectoine hydroxylase-related dioxygenase, phytanoyl-CoA dioxygenase (PhyH) family [Sphingomonas jatrophae]